MKKETYLIIGSDSEEDLGEILLKGKAAGINLITIGETSLQDMKYDEITVYKKGLDALLTDGLSGCVVARCSYTMLSRELEFWSYLERLAKRMGLKVLREHELLEPKKIDFESLKNPNPELHEKMLKITKAFKDAVQNAMDSEEEEVEDFKKYLNRLYGYGCWNRSSGPHSISTEFCKYQDVIYIDDAFQGPYRSVVNIDVYIGGGRNSRGDQTGGHGSSCDDCTGGSRKSRFGRDASCGGYCSESV